MKKIVLTIIIAFILWGIMLSPLTAPYVNFWWMMTGSAVTLAIFSTLFSRVWVKQVKLNTTNIALGIAIAFALWCAFWLGEKIASWLFDFARTQVDTIYGLKHGESVWLLSGLMLFLIGPAEEIFWRGYVQRELSERWNANKGFIVTTLIYTLVHVSSCNFMLTMSALVAGFAWGLLYRLFPKYFGAIILSHALWDAAVFIWFPIE